MIDFGGATYDSDSKSTIISTRQYRAPEVMLGLNWSTPADLWSAGCIIGELYLGNLFFPTHEQMEHYAMIEKCVGPFPKTMISKALGARIEACDVRTYFKTSTFELRPLHTHLKSSSRRRVENMPHLQNAFSTYDGNTGLLDLMRNLLTIDPKKRITAKMALSHPFFEPCRRNNRTS